MREIIIKEGENLSFKFVSKDGSSTYKRCSAREIKMMMIPFSEAMLLTTGISIKHRKVGRSNYEEVAHTEGCVNNYDILNIPMLEPICVKWKEPYLDWSKLAFMAPDPNVKTDLFRVFNDEAFRYSSDSDKKTGDIPEHCGIKKARGEARLW